MQKLLTRSPPPLRSAVKWVVDEIVGVHGQNPDFADPLICYEYSAAVLFFVQTRLSAARADAAEALGDYEVPRTVTEALERGYGRDEIQADLFAELMRKTGLEVRRAELYFVDQGVVRAQRFVEVWWSGAWRLFDPGGGWHPWRDEVRKVCSLDDILDGRPFETVMNTAIPSTAATLASHPDHFIVFARSPVIGRITDGAGLVQPPIRNVEGGLTFDPTGLPALSGGSGIGYRLGLPEGEWRVEAVIERASGGARLALAGDEGSLAPGDAVIFGPALGEPPLTVVGEPGAQVWISSLKAMRS